MTGLGDRLICLGAAWLFARYTGRTLVVDWRRSLYSSDFHRNSFTLSFQPTSELAGVPFICDDRVDSISYPRPRYPSLWNRDGLLAGPHRRPDRSIERHRDAAVDLIRKRADVRAPTVVFDACINDGLVSVADSQEFFRLLRPIESVTRQVAEYRETQFGESPFIGLHARHGNGALSDHSKYWHSFQAAIDRCERAVRAARDRLGPETPVFLCTDNVEVETAIRCQIPGVVTRDKLFRNPNEGELHLSSESHLGRDDALIEMLLLAEAKALIRFPPGSFFSFYPAVMRQWESPPPPTVYDLLLPHDPTDALSPTLII